MQEIMWWCGGGGLSYTAVSLVDSYLIKTSSPERGGEEVGRGGRWKGGGGIRQLILPQWFFPRSCWSAAMLSNKGGGVAEHPHQTGLKGNSSNSAQIVCILIAPLNTIKTKA